MVQDKTAEDSAEESIDPPGDRTEQVAALSPKEAQALLEHEADDLDNQPTKKMGALSAEEASRIAAASGKRRSSRVFRPPSVPPRLELPLATAQHQAVGIERVAGKASAPSSATRVKVATITLAVAFLVGGIVAWAIHKPYVTTTPLLPRPPSQTVSPPSAEQEVQTPLPSEAIEPPNEATSESASETAELADPAEPTGPERAEALLAQAEGLRGNALRNALEEAASADPSNPHAASALAEFHMESDPHKALEWALQASQLRRRRASYRELVADAYERIGNLNNAARARAAAEALRAGN